MFRDSKKLINKRSRKEFEKVEGSEDELLAFKRNRQKEYSRKNRVRRKEYI